MTTATQVKATVDALVADGAKLRQIIHGDVDELVNTDAGPVMTVAGLEREFRLDAADAITQVENARDAVKPLFGNGPPTKDMGVEGSIYTDISNPLNSVIYGPKGTTWGPGRSNTGLAGPSNNTRIDLVALKAAAITDRTSLYDRSLWTWETAGAPYIADDVNVVKAASTALAVGAWVRQRAENLSTRRAAVDAIIRTAQTEFSESFKFTQFALPGQPAGVGNPEWDTAAFNRAVEFAWTRSRSVCIPDNDQAYIFNSIVLPANEAGQDGDGARSDRFTICGTGTVRFDASGFLFDCAPGTYFYDLVVQGSLRFEGTRGLGGKLFNGDKFVRLTLCPGLNVRNIDYCIYGQAYLQTVRAMGVTCRGQIAFVKAPMAYDTRLVFNIVEFGTDGIIIDGSGDPAVHTCTISDNVIEGLVGRGIAVGTCLATRICGNYMEDNRGADILLNRGTAAHKGLIVQSNSLQQSADRKAAGAYSIVHGSSMALPILVGGNFSTGNLHDLTGTTSILNTIGDTVSTGKNLTTPNVGREIGTDGFTVVARWFDRKARIDPYMQEIAFDGPLSSGGPPIVETIGVNSPSNTPSAFERKEWAKGSLVRNINATTPGDATGWICTQSGTPGSWRPQGVLS